MKNILETPAEITELLKNTKTVAVLGIKTEAQSDQPAFYVPSFVKQAGFTVIPVPIYYPDVTEILQEKVYRKLTDISVAVDLVDVFRKPSDIDKHVDEILEKKPLAVWFQSGIKNDRAAKIFSDAGIKVVQDRCLMVEIQSRR